MNHVFDCTRIEKLKNHHTHCQLPTLLFDFYLKQKQKKKEKRKKEKKKKEKKRKKKS
tara:strand:+ start:711 stop:881 length:171 start_codon:yes stop_codon:yes gene_type:complete